MKIGVVGAQGVVGNAVVYGMEKLGHEVKVHDIRLDSSLDNVIDTEVCFICVPTPQSEDGSCNIGIVESVLDGLLKNRNYSGVIAIKSTVSPGTTEKLISKYDSKGWNICFVPEFLRERHAISDFTENHDICVVGVCGPYAEHNFKLVVNAHGKYPQKIIMMTPTEAELTKYFSNVFNAMRVIFANGFYEVCKELGADYTAIKNAVVQRPTMVDLYLDCNEKFRGFAGVCVTPDTKVYMGDGYKNASDIEVGNKVLTINGSLQSVTETMSRHIDEEILEIRGQGLESFRITKEHPVYAVKANRKPYGATGKLSNFTGSEYNFEWIPADELKKGDFIALPKKLHKCTKAYDLSPDLARLCGYYMAEGSVENDCNRVSLAFHSKETEYHQDIKSIVEKELDVPCYIYVKDNRANIRFSSKKGRELLLKHCGRCSDKKRISNELMNSPTRYIRQFIKGYWRGDGSSSTGAYSVATISEQLYYQLKLILLRYGIAFTTSIRPARVGKDGTNHKKAYYIRIRNMNSIKIFGSLINDPIERKVKFNRKTSFFSNEVSAITPGAIKGNTLIIPIKDIKKVKYSGLVYNFEVENNNTYVINDAIVHNCLPKDTAAFAKLVNDLDINARIFSTIVKDNKLYKPTVSDGMRLK